MAGIYIHVPYCTTRCIYCDFFTQTNLNSQSDFIQAICNEIDLRKNYLEGEKIETIYFGGGTPSLLSKIDFVQIFSKIYTEFSVNSDAEITLEANPDDLNTGYFKHLESLPFNRISIGIQSFDDSELMFLKRRHTAKAAINSVNEAKSFGFQNISVDLIYGLPNQTIDVWQKNIEQAINLDIQHISSYHLIYEEKTKLMKLLDNRVISEVSESLSLDMFQLLITMLKDDGFDYYEISNFAKNGLYSKHNTSYWQGKKYLGLGPAAHSFNGESRTFNIPSISKYVDGINENKLDVEVEELDQVAQYNELILTGLRTKWGVNLEKLRRHFGDEFYEYCLSNANKYILTENVVIKDNILKLTLSGVFISDEIMSSLMWV